MKTLTGAGDARLSLTLAPADPPSSRPRCTLQRSTSQAPDAATAANAMDVIETDRLHAALFVNACESGLCMESRTRVIEEVTEACGVSVGRAAREMGLREYLHESVGEDISPHEEAGVWGQGRSGEKGTSRSDS